jgi:hypothetical protein
MATVFTHASEELGEWGLVTSTYSVMALVILGSAVSLSKSFKCAVSEYTFPPPVM